MATAPKKSAAQRIADLKPRFQRIKLAIMATDALLDDYFRNRADEIEAFSGELQELTGAPDQQPN